jgi:hypothetical protein
VAHLPREPIGTRFGRPFTHFVALRRAVEGKVLLLVQADNGSANEPLVPNPIVGGLSMIKRFRKTTGLLAAVAAVAAAFGANAFTATNTVGTSKAGAGAGAISGYAVTEIAYTNAAGKITGVTFKLDGAASNVKVTLVDNGTEYDCGASAPTTHLVTCTVDVPATTADSLTVVANQ